MPPASRQSLFTIAEVASKVLDRSGVPFVVGGGLAAEAYHLRETANDVDLFVRPRDAPRGLSALAQAGFYVWIEDPRWLYKAIKDDVTVDLIYESSGVVHVADETFQRARWMQMDHTRLPIMPPEDLFVMKAAAATPAAPKHWLDAVSLLDSQQMDWEYLARRATRSPRKVLQAIVHAYDEGVPVPSFVFVRLAQDLIK